VPRDIDLAETFYGRGADGMTVETRQRLERRSPELFEIAGAGPAQQQALGREADGAVAGLGGYASALREQVFNDLVADTLATARAQPEPDDATRQQWREETRRLLQQEYGAENTQIFLGRVQKYLRTEAGRPLAAFLHRAGRGDEARYVLPLVRFVIHTDFR